MSKKIDVKVLKEWIKEKRKVFKKWIREEMKSFREELRDETYGLASAAASWLLYDCGYLHALENLEEFLEEVE